MSKQNWLNSEILAWQKEGLVTSDQVRAIQAYYANKPTGNWARLLFSVIGAVLFGLGVILFFAWNWDDMPKAAKLGLIFAGLLASQSAGLWFHFKGYNRALGEGFAGLGTLLFGSGMILIAQIYHIDEHFPNSFVVWGLAALAMAWVLASVTQGFLAVLLLTMWFATEMWSFDSTMHAAAPLIGLGLLPLAWRERSAWLFGVAMLAFILTLLVSAVDVSEAWRWAFADAILLAVSLILIHPTVYRADFSHIASTLHNLGFLGYIILLYLFSFDEAASIFRETLAARQQDWFYFSVLAAAALAALVIAIRRELARPRQLDQLHYPLVLLSLVLILGAFFRADSVSHWLWTVTNVILLTHAIVWILTGSRDQRGRVVAMAAVLFVMVAVPRFLDLFDSLLMRALMFLLLGASLFLLGNFYQRQGRRHAPELTL